MTPEELLSPRYRVIADYPFSPYKVGQLVSQSGKTSVYPSFLLTVVFYENDDGKKIATPNWSLIEYIEKYPHLFKKLEWWEERKESELSRYVRYIVDGNIYDLGGLPKEGNLYLIGDYSFGIRNCTPATKEEYEKQQP